MLRVVCDICKKRHVFAILVVALFLSAVSVGSVHAETVDYSVNVKPSLKVSISPNPVVLNLNPSSKPFSTADVNITVGTNNKDGYELYMGAEGDSTRLERDATSDNITANIGTLEGSMVGICADPYTETDFINFFPNSWGYRINNQSGGRSKCIDTTGTKYYGYTPGTLISSSNGPVNEKTANLTFAANINYNRPAGQYSLTLKMKAVPYITTYHMQDVIDPAIASIICTTDPTIVFDARDEHLYTIRKLTDDRCWMTANLDLAGGTTLTPADSNVSENYTLPASETIASGVTLANASAFSDNNTAYVLNTNSTTCSSDSPCYSYYNYVAATAGTNPETGDATSDICPKGWKLPTSEEYERLANTVVYVDGFGKTNDPAIHLNFVPSGQYPNNSNFVGGGTFGKYLSATAEDDYFINVLEHTSKRISLEFNTRRVGFAIRCIAKTE